MLKNVYITLENGSKAKYYAEFNDGNGHIIRDDNGIKG